MPYKTYKGEDSIEKLYKALFSEANRIIKCMNRYRNIEDMKITKRQQKEYKNSNYCYVCKNNFTRENYKAKDHCHVTGVYRGAACNNCNLQLRLTNRIPVVFHNLRGYAGHSLIQKLRI